MVSDRAKWALIIIQEAGFVEGVTRLHKYAFLIAMRNKPIISAGFYNDWKPSDYGPFSKQLALDIKDLKESGLIKESVKTNQYGYKVGVLMPTETSTAFTDDIRDRYERYVKEIQKIVKMYQGKQLIDVLHDVYALYPQYATKSTIRAQVGKQVYESDSYLNPQYDESTD